MDTLVEEKFTNVGSFISLSSIGIGHCSAFRSYLHNGLGKEQERFNSRAFSLAVLHSVSLGTRRSVSRSRSHLSMQFIFPGSLILKLSSILTREFQSSFIGKRRNRKLGFDKVEGSLARNKHFQIDEFCSIFLKK